MSAGIVDEDLLLELAEGRSRLEPELVPEQPSRPSERVERVRLAPGAVEREPELGAEPLVERMLGDQRLDLADELGVTAERELGVDQILVRREPVEEEMRQLDRREELEFAAGERRAAPQSERRPELLSALEIVAASPAPRPRVARTGPGRSAPAATARR